MIVTGKAAEAVEIWRSMAQPIAYGLLAGEVAARYYRDGDRSRGLAHIRIAIGHVATASDAALNAGDAHPEWVDPAALMNGYAWAHIAGLDQDLEKMRHGKTIAHEPTREQVLELQRMVALQRGAIEGARALVASVGGDPAAIVSPSAFHEALKAQTRLPPWHESEN